MLFSERNVVFSGFDFRDFVNKVDLIRLITTIRRSISAATSLLFLILMLNSNGVSAEQLCEFISANQWASFDSMPKIETTPKPSTAQEYYDLAVNRYFENLYEGRVTQSNIVYKQYLSDKLSKQSDAPESVIRQIKNKIIELDGEAFDSEISTLLLKAAKKGHKEAQFCLGRIFEYGVGTQINYVDAYSWYAVASSSMTPGGDALMWGVSQRLEGSEITLAEKKAKKYIKEYTDR